MLFLEFQKFPFRCTKRPQLQVRLLAENEVIVEEKKALLAQIEKEQGNLSQYHERQSKCNSEKADLEIALTQAQQKLADTEQARIQVG